MKKRNRDQWLALFAQHDISGVSAAEFCKQNDLCPKYFSLRRKQLVKAASEEKSSFVRVKVKPETTPGVSEVSGAALIIHNGAGQMVFGALPQPGWLAQLLRELT